MNESTSILRSPWVPAVAGAVGVTASLILWSHLRESDSRVAQTRVEMEAKEWVSSIERETRGSQVDVDLLSTMLEWNAQSGEAFPNAARKILQGSRLESIAWAPQEAGDPASELRVHFQETLLPAAPLPAGTALSSEPNLHSAAHEALALGESFSTLLTLGGDSELICCVLAPVRSPSGAGVLIGMARMSGFVGASVAHLGENDFQLSISDLAQRQTFHYPPPTETPPAVLTALSSTRSLDFGGRVWHLACVPTREFVASQKSSLPRGSLLASLLVTGGLVVYLRRVSRERTGVEREVARRTRQLQSVNEALRQEMAGRQESERALSESLAAYQSLIESLPLNVFRKNLAGEIVSANARFCQTVGRDLSEVLGKSDLDLFHRAQATKYRADDERVIQTGAVWEDIEEHVRPDGGRLFVQVLKAPARDANQQIVGVQGMFWDVTERKLSEEARRHSDARVRQLVESNLIGVAIGQGDGALIEANGAFLQIVGADSEQLRAGELNWLGFWDASQRPREAQRMDALKRDGRCAPWETLLAHRDGRTVAVLAGATRMAGPPEELIWFVLDISKRKQMERELQQAKEAADAASLAKSRFLANMSHEVRTPLNAVIGLTELTLATALSAKQRDYLGMVREAGESLLRIINDVLLFSKAEAGKISLESCEFDVRELIDSTVKTLGIRADDQRVEVASHVGADVPQRMIGDAGRLEQVVNNLVSNAIKFTEAGEVEVSVHCRPLQAPCAELQIEVRDTGIGIPREHLEKVFDAFEQVDASITRSHSGTGLGLAIVKELAELMGGRTWVESVVGRGSKFHFAVPVEVAFEQRPRSPLPEARVLVVDDHAITRRILRDLLSDWQLRAEFVASSNEARAALAEAAESGAPFDVLIADLPAPDADASDLISQVRSDQRLPQPAIVLLTSSQSSSGPESTQTHQVDVHLLKPLKQSELRGALESVLAPSPPGVETEISVRPKLPRLKILAAEDSPLNQVVIRGMLEEHDLLLTENGQEALDQWAGAGVGAAFDLILMDVRMPVLDGLQATEAIRRQELRRSTKTPIVGMTAHALPEDLQNCLASGMDAVLTKPIRSAAFHQMLARVAGGESLAGFREEDYVGAAFAAGRAPDSAPPGGAAGRSEGGGSEGGRSEAPAPKVDWDAALETVEGNRGLFVELIGMFREEAPTLMERIDDAIERLAPKALLIGAHTLKGALRYFGPTDAAQLALRLESCGRQEQLDGAAQPELRRTAAELRRQVDQLLPCLLEYAGQHTSS